MARISCGRHAFRRFGVLLHTLFIALIALSSFAFAQKAPTEPPTQPGGQRRCNAEPYACSPTLFHRDEARRQKSDAAAVERKKTTQEIFKTLDLLYFSSRRFDQAHLSERAPDFAKAFQDDIGEVDIFGIATVAVPANRDPAQKSYVPKGALKSPRWHFYMFRHQALAEREMVALAKEKTGSSQAPQVLLYVHGIRNALPDAAETLAQLVVDTGFTGKAMFMSWPAPITLLPNDENYRENKAFALAPKSVNLLGGVLEDFLLDGGADLHLLAHSAGADLSVNALQVVTPDIRRSPSLASIVLAAADSELPQFEVKVAPALSRQGRIVVNYCGESDRALRESRHTQRATRIRKDREVGDAR